MDAVTWIKELAARSFYPAQVETALLRLDQSWPGNAPPLRDLLEQFPLCPNALPHLLAVSSIAVSRITRNPELLIWLARPEISDQPRSYAGMLADLTAAGAEDLAADQFRALRRWKHREMSRIALREVANVAPLEETTAEISQVAEICVRRVFEHWNIKLRESGEAPAAEFAILALGKLGGRELNFSSDVDLIFVYGEEGDVSPGESNHQWFNRLAEKILATFSAPDPEGPLWRIDLRLRPEGAAGPLVRSLESMENYYAGFGETWERLALIKARGICGSRELAYEFLRQHQPFIYPRSPTPDLLDEVANIKRRIERDVVGPAKVERDVKLGRGGIREIEFVVQTLQFIHGGRQTFLQETSTLAALRGLARLEIISRDRVLDLDRAYRFLRRVEHRLQIESEQQTHLIPRDQAVVERLARSLAFKSSDEFITALRETMQRVRSVFDSVISSESTETAPDLKFFHDEKAAERSLGDLIKPTSASHVAPRTRQVFAKLRPLLLDRLRKSAEPDATLNRFVRFMEAYGLRGLLFELLATNPRLLELLVKILDASRFAADQLIRRPRLLEEVTRDKSFNQARSVAENLERLESFGATAANLDAVRAYRQRQLLRVMMRDVLGVAELRAILRELSDLAEACLTFTANLIGEQNLTIIALGKFGGREISYGADLDVIFIGDDPRGAQGLIAAISQPSGEGTIGTLDARLRPDGEKGSLVAPLAAYEAYYRQRAQLWEIHALTRARPIFGPLQDSYLEMAKNIWLEIGQQPDLFIKIDEMLGRIRSGSSQSSGNDFLDFKTGDGGMIEAEFLVQALQMRSGTWNTNWQDALMDLRKNGIVSAENAKDVALSYEILRRCENALRRLENKTASALPANTEEQYALARRLGYANPETFSDEYRAGRETIHRLYQKYIKQAAG